MNGPSPEDMLERERIANRKKHWVRLVTACNSRCLFCLDADTPRNVFLPEEEIKAELRRGREALDADKVILSGGEASLHPAYPTLIRYARSIGYERVQTVTNGWRYAERDFYDEVMAAGLGEITFSLHGHTAALHDHLTQHPGSFARLIKGLVRALRDPKGPIVNVDVVINKQNVGVLDQIVQLAISLGVTEFDLLHVIPQSNAFENRDSLFYDAAEHLPMLHKVFRLNRHPRFVIWTNRFPVEFLEGMEDLIQDPHKMLDEVNGRRFMVRNYLDTGKKLDCRDPERCKHCFIEPFCETMDRTLAAQRTAQVDRWVGPPVAGQLPFGATEQELSFPDAAALAAFVPSGDWGLLARLSTAESVAPRPGLRLVARTAAQLEAWLPAGHPLLIELNTDTAPALLAHREALAAALPRLTLHQPSHEHLSEAAAADLRDPAAFFTALALPIATTGLAPCEAPGTRLQREPEVQGLDLFDDQTGRIDINPLARHHVSRRYRAKSMRCRGCRVEARCDGIAINRVRDQGLQLARPLTEGPWAEEADRQLRALFPEAPLRVAAGRPVELPPPSLPGFAPPAGPVTDPLAEVARKLAERRAARAAARGA